MSNASLEVWARLYAAALTGTATADLTPDHITAQDARIATAALEKYEQKAAEQ